MEHDLAATSLQFRAQAPQIAKRCHLRGRPLPARSSSFCSEQLLERNLFAALSAASLGRAVLDLPKCFTTSRTATHPRRASSSSSSFLRCLRGTQRARHAGVLGWPRYSAFVLKASILRICCSQGRLSHPVRKALPITQTISTTLNDLPNWTPITPQQPQDHVDVVGSREDINGGVGIMGVAVREGDGGGPAPRRGGRKGPDRPDEGSSEKYGQTLPSLIRLGMVSSVHFQIACIMRFCAILERRT